jgi:hypothetical protein
MAGSLTEVKRAYSKVEKWSKPEAAPLQLNYVLSKPTVRKEPKGVVVIIVPYNYPLWLTFSPLVSIKLGCSPYIFFLPTSPGGRDCRRKCRSRETFRIDPCNERFVRGALRKVLGPCSVPCCQWRNSRNNACESWRGLLRTFFIILSPKLLSLPWDHSELPRFSSMKPVVISARSFLYR